MKLKMKKSSLFATCILIAIIASIGYTWWTSGQIRLSETPTTAPTIAPTRTKEKLNHGDLAFLYWGISYEEVVNHIGEPDSDNGSGIYLFEYTLEDGGVLTLSFVYLDNLDHATIHETDGTWTTLIPYSTPTPFNIPIP